MAPMGIRLSPLGVAVFCLLGVGVIYHLYAGVISNRLSAFRQRSVNLRELLAVSVEAAVLGGREVKKVREENVLMEKSKGKTKEGASELLTLGDLRSHRRMFNLLRNTFPDVLVHSEEHDNTVDKDATWSRDIPADILDKVNGRKEVPAESITVWIDPLDATQEYTAWALVDGGTNMGRRSTYSINPPKVIVSRSHSGKVKGYVQDAFGNSTTIIPAGGAGYKVLSLLEMPASKSDTIDQADIYIHVTFIKKWDICAGAAILNALGGRMTTLKGEDIDYSGEPLNKGGLLATVGVNHISVLEKLPSWDPEDKQ
ncbi:inositol monophosphatase 3 isoform X2 [Synchiropus splendidus]|uniref:inositol monophosphatase 3 isoform X2 n=1 Tax=Synchiropus splendidus TaxID=270530 RepID=UPI00237DCDE4|nr:inositol monophosphatase 3 isoform X2 [Synchiropus splendidus]